MNTTNAILQSLLTSARSRLTDKKLTLHHFLLGKALIYEGQELLNTAVLVGLVEADEQEILSLENQIKYYTQAA